ncbi:DUF3047 domain-containing protein [Caenimonas aquaedulcis]|uniref:DUF3047 domain-containing protein n=1 Tax=Caenimonas aquaedulcis TaxID=2793270 RepID=A0A931H655_9BURK|nr:DUF3047 domain-containing protein [Caenimonas aquaedulcis]MBG9389365.1 DUF3047 domain-containing protein [Caenimonas aquaedulcis]
MKLRWGLAAAAVAVCLAGCAVVRDGAGVGAGAGAVAANPWSAQSGPDAQSWHHMTFPGKAATRFSYSRKDGRDAIAVLASSSASMLRQKLRVEPSELRHVRFSWKVPQLIAGADVGLRDADDSPVRVMLFFEGDRARFSARDSMLSELLRAVSGEEMPYATLMYVWCNQREPGSVITSPRTGRVRTLVVESGARKLGQWLDYERDIRADYLRAYGEAPGALVGIAIMSDSDNTQSTTQAWYGPVRLQTP